MTERDNARAVVFQWRLNRFVSYISKIQGDQSNFQNFPYHALVKNDQKTRSVCSLIKCRENARKRTPPPQKNKMAADISVVKRGFSFYLWIRWDFFIVFFFPYHLSIRVSRVENLRNNFPHHDLAENKKLASRKSVHLIMAQRWKMINIFAAAAQPHFPRPAGSTRPPSATFSNAVFFH